MRGEADFNGPRAWKSLPDPKKEVPDRRIRNIFNHRLGLRTKPLWPRLVMVWGKNKKGLK